MNVTPKMLEGLTHIAAQVAKGGGPTWLVSSIHSTTLMRLRESDLATTVEETCKHCGHTDSLGWVLTDKGKALLEAA